MKKFTVLFCLLAGIRVANGQVSENLAPYLEDYTLNGNGQLGFASLKAAAGISADNAVGFINASVLNNSATKAAVSKTERDELGFTHTRYGLQLNGITVFNKMLIAHSKDGKLVSLNGDLSQVAAPSNGFSLSEKSALALALKKVGAQKYKWENKEEEQHMREALNQPDFTFYPKATKVVFEKGEKTYHAYQFTIYAETPLYRANVFVDASTGAILAEQSLIMHADVPGTALTKYSATQTLTCDQNTGSYRLRQTQRGLGIDTYNMNNSTTYSATDFTNASTAWTSTGNNQAATDAHWGAEKTYDYFQVRFNRNSIDNAGYKLLSYLHYGNNYNNAFWDGLRMTYGDGNGSTFTIFTALDVCGHEITHGLVSNTGQLNGGGTGEPDALNEAFADIFGTSIERYARPSNWNWKMGTDITINGNGLRNMQNPKQMSDPDTYLGQYWDAAGEPHNNAGPCIRWFYLLVSGGSGTNDNSNAYNVTGLGNIDAERIAYRALTVYFTPGTGYASARTAAIQAAKDLFGNCSNQVTQTANAWYAVGVGPQFSPGLIAPNFVAQNTSYCSMPVNVTFSNTTTNGLSYTWYFGDGGTATATNAAHSYTTNGVYTVKLKATGCTGMDSITKTAYITVNVPQAPVANNLVLCGNSSTVISATGNSTIKWYANATATAALATGTSFTTPVLNANTTYYVANTSPNSPVNGGRLANTNGGYLTNSQQWLVFDVSQPSFLNSVVVYAQTAGNRVIELRNASGGVINSFTANLIAGTNTVNLNFYLNTGLNLQLGLNSTSASGLYRSNSNNVYPYNIGGVVNITGSSAGTGFYYWFYNWQVTKADCSSQRVPVTVSVSPAAPLSITVPSTLVCHDDGAFAINAGPAGGTLSGNGISNGNFNPATGAGSYYVKYVFTDANGCTNSDSLNILVDICAGLSASARADGSLLIYPNPFKNSFSVKSTGNSACMLRVTDATGRVVLSRELGSTEQAIDLGHVANGLYLATMSDASGRVLRTVKLVKE